MAASAIRNALLRHLRVKVGSAAPPVSLSFGHLLRRFSDEVKGSFLDKSEVAERVITVVKNFQKVEPSKCVRNFATQATPNDVKVKVPLALFGGSGNYASALFIAASKSNVLDKVESEILDIVEASKKSPLFSQFAKDLSVPRETRVKAINEIFSEAGLTEVTKNFLAVLADNGRLRNIERIAKRFVELTMAHKGVIKVTVTTVIPLPAEEEKELTLTLNDVMGKGKHVKIEQKIDPSIMGGLVVEFSQKVFDMSIRTRAKQMEKFLREPLNFDNL